MGMLDGMGCWRVEFTTGEVRSVGAAGLLAKACNVVSGDQVRLRKGRSLAHAWFEACVGWGAIQKEEIFAGLDQTSTLWF